MDKEKLKELVEICPVLTSYEGELVRLREVEGKMNREVAAIVGKAPSTVSYLHKRALKKLMEWEKQRE